MQYISGEAFKNICKYNLDNRYTLIPIDSSLEENDRVFIKQGDIDAFIKTNPAKKVILIVHNTDETFDDAQMDRVKPYINKVYAVNSSAKDAIQIPLGFRDDQYTSHKVLDEQKSIIDENRNILCLLNFSIGTGNNERSDALNAFKHYTWAVKNTNNTPALHLDHKNRETIRLREEFYKTLNKTKFVICPFGAGKDTHRVYEALFFGAIPIIKSSFLDPMYKALGECWIVNEWSEVTEDECNKHWASRSLKPFKNNVNDWLNMNSGSNKVTFSFITYGDDNFKNAKERIINEVKNTGIFNGNIKAYGPEDLSDDFVKKLGNIINESRGGGYWLWKPYIIYDMLNKINMNDILVYTDSGCSINTSGNKRLNEYIDMISPKSGYSVLAMQLKSGKHDNNSLKSKVWTSSPIFDYFNIKLNSTIANNDSILATMIILRKSPESLSVIRRWLDVAEQKPDLFTDKYNSDSKLKNPDFKENRHDQSILSIIVQIAPYNKYVKIIEEEIEGKCDAKMPICATRKRQGGGFRNIRINNKNEKVSIIIPTYNRFKYLLNTINSIKEQTYKNIEIIIVNDKSTENEYYTHNFGENIKVIHLPKNTKEIYGFPCAGHVRNEGIKISTGKYIAFCDDDDTWLPNKLDLQLNAMNENNCKMSCTEGITGNGVYNKLNKYKKYNAEKHLEIIKNIFREKQSNLIENGFPKIWTLELIKIHNCAITSSVIIFKEILDKIHNFKNIKNGDEDYDCWKHALEHTNMVYVEEPCVYYDNSHGYGRQYGGQRIKEENECMYVSTRGVLKSCDIHSKEISSKNFNSYNNMKNIKDYDTIYIRSSKFKDFINYFSKITKKVILVLGDGDETFPKDFWNTENDFIKFIENPNIIRIFSINTNTKHNKLTIYPIGLNYHTMYTTNDNPSWGAKMNPEEQDKEIEEIRSKGLPFFKRKIQCYSNFHFNMQEDRKYTQDRRNAKAYIPAECIDYESSPVSRRETHLKQLDYAFVICPHGNGLDCYRQWEALVLGCIPVVKTSSIDAVYDELPVLIVNDWKNINKELLQSTVNNFKNKQFNYDKLKLDYWMAKINSYKI